jgi:hypothetical protein
MRANPLRKLPQVRPRQKHAEFGLADQDDLQQLGLISFQIGEQADLFQDFEAEILRLVDQNDGPPSSRVDFKEMSIQEIDQLFQVRPVFGVGDAQFVADAGEKFSRAQSRIENQGEIDVLGQAVDKTAAQGRFSGSDLPREYNEPTAHADPVQEMS